MKNSFDSRSTLTVGDARYEYFDITKLNTTDLPFSLKILLENLLRREDGDSVTADDIQAVARWQPAEAPSQEIAFMPSRVLLQDFTGVPAVVDLKLLLASFFSSCELSAAPQA